MVWNWYVTMAYNLRRHMHHLKRVSVCVCVCDGAVVFPKTGAAFPRCGACSEGSLCWNLWQQLNRRKRSALTIFLPRNTTTSLACLYSARLNEADRPPRPTPWTWKAYFWFLYPYCYVLPPAVSIWRYVSPCVCGSMASFVFQRG